MDRVLSAIWRSQGSSAVRYSSVPWTLSSSCPLATNRSYSGSSAQTNLEPPEPTIDHASGREWKRGFVHRRARAKAKVAEKSLAKQGVRGAFGSIDKSSARSVNQALKEQARPGEESALTARHKFYSAYSAEPEIAVGGERDNNSDQQLLAEEDLDNEKPTGPKDWKYWRKHKAAIKRKLQGESWAPPGKLLSPDTMDGIRAMHNAYPNQLTTPVLAKHFEVSPEAIRRILKSKWKPTEEEDAKRRERWEKRGQDIWTKRADSGFKLPKKWQGLGVDEQNSGSVKAQNAADTAVSKLQALSKREIQRPAKNDKIAGNELDSAWWKDNVAASIADNRAAIPEL